MGEGRGDVCKRTFSPAPLFERLRREALGCCRGWGATGEGVLRHIPPLFPPCLLTRPKSTPLSPSCLSIYQSPRLLPHQAKVHAIEPLLRELDVPLDLVRLALESDRQRDRRRRLQLGAIEHLEHDLADDVALLDGRELDRDLDRAARGQLAARGADGELLGQGVEAA